MSESAGSPALRRRITRQREIHAAACRLVLDRGYDGFTMDDLAAAVGVSRRTLFNHVPDKASAVVGAEDDQVLGATRAFLAGGPSGVLFDDVLAVVARLSADLEADDPGSVERHQLREAAIAADPKVRSLAEEQYARVFDDVVDALCRREGWPQGDLRARTTGATLLALVRVALDEVATGRQSTFHDAFVAVADAHRDVLRQR